MDLSDERKKTLQAMPVEKKWTMVASHPSEPTKHPTEFLNKMKSIMAEKDHKVLKGLGGERERESIPTLRADCFWHRARMCQCATCRFSTLTKFHHIHFTLATFDLCWSRAVFLQGPWQCLHGVAMVE